MSNSIDNEEVYRLIFSAHQLGAEFREKIVRGWLLGYVALAGAFGWAFTKNDVKPLSWIVTLSGLVFTIMMWLADIRNRAAIRGAKEVGEAIERYSFLPNDQRFFTGLKGKRKWWRFWKWLTHSFVIDCFAIVMIVVLFLATRYLFIWEEPRVSFFRLLGEFIRPTSLN